MSASGTRPPAGHSTLYVDEQSTVAAQALLAAVGVRRLLELSPKSLTEADARRAVALPGKIATNLRHFLSGDGFDAQEAFEKSTFDFQTVAEDLGRAEDVTRAHQLIANFDDAELGESMLVLGFSAIQRLKLVLPARAQEDVLAGEPMEPSTTERYQFQRAWDVASDPLVVFRNMRTGLLTPDEVEAFALTYPDIYGRSKDILVELIIEKKTTKPKWTLPFHKRMVIEIFAQRSTMSDGFLAQLQRAAQAQTAKVEDKGGGSLEALRSDVNQGLTPTMRIAQR